MTYNDGGDELVCLSWLCRHVVGSLLVKDAAWDAMLLDEAKLDMVSSFLRDEAVGRLVIVVHLGTLDVSLQLPAIFDKGLYFLKKLPIRLTPENVSTVIVCGDVCSDNTQQLHQLSSTLDEVYLPLLNNTTSLQEWPETVRLDLKKQFHDLSGMVFSSKGRENGNAFLPVQYTQAACECVDAREKIHMIEAAVAKWMSQIQRVLATECHGVNQSEAQLGVKDAIEFWTSKAENLKLLNQQLNDSRCIAVIQFLAQSSSSYFQPMAHLKEDIVSGLEEAHDIASFLAPLHAPVNQLATCPFESIATPLKHVMHVISLVWSFSRHFGQPTRVVALMIRLCNDVMKSAIIFVNCLEIFTLSPEEATRRLTVASAICHLLKRSFLETKARVRMIRKNDRSWRVESSLVFGRIDIFARRCHDALHLIQTKVAFSSIPRIYIGGTSGKMLTTQLYEINYSYEALANDLRSAEANVFELENTEFDSAFSQFCTSVKELEIQIASVLNLACDDCSTVLAATKLLDSFDDMLRQPVLLEKVEQSIVDLVVKQTSEVRCVTAYFSQWKLCPPTQSNMPPISGAITWGRSLIQRVKTPVEKMVHMLSIHNIQCQECDSMLCTYQQFVDSVSLWENEQWQCWNDIVDKQLSMKLRNSLLVRHADDGEIQVNFDPSVTAVLRECKYLMILDMPIPESALTLYQQGEAYRVYTVKLGAVETMYNKLNRDISEIERPLLSARWNDLNSAVEKGINSFNWNSHGIAEYIGRLYTVTRALFELVSTLKSHVKSIRDVFAILSDVMLFEKKADRRVIAVHDVNERITSFVSQGTKDASDVHSICDVVQQLLEATTATPGWRAFVDYMSQQVGIGLVSVVRTHLTQLLVELDSQHGEFMEIQVELSSNQHDVNFNPDIDTRDSSTGLTNTILFWVRSLCQLGALVQRIDGPGSYSLDVIEDPVVRSKVARVENKLCAIVDALHVFRTGLFRYSFLWQDDSQQVLNQFMIDQQATNPSGDVMHAPLGYGSPTLDDFEVQIEKYKDLHFEITNTESSTTIGWLRIDLRRIKHQLGSQTIRWRNTFARFLSEGMSSGLNEMEELMTTTQNAFAAVERLKLGKVPKAEETLILENIMQCLHSLDKHAEIYHDVSVPVNKCILLLRRYNIDIPDDIIVKLDTCPKQWRALELHATAVKQTIKPFLADIRNKLQRDEEDFKRRVSKFVHAFHASVAFKWDPSGPFTAYDAINGHYAELTDLEEDAAQLCMKQHLMSVPMLTIETLIQCRAELLLQKKVWDVVAVVLAQFQSWRRTALDTADVSTIMTQTNDLLRQVSTVDEQAQQWNVLQEMMVNVHNFANSLPLVEKLRNDAIRDRHWKQVMKITRKQFMITDDVTLGDILQLNLHTSSSEVLAIVEQSVRELSVENFLHELQLSWQNVNLTFGVHKTKNIPLLRCVDQIRDTIQDGQVALQTITSNKIVAYFENDISIWMTSLTTIENVISSWTDVQKAWCSLENIFSSSKDIRSRLPKETKLFDSIEVDWREMMSSISEEMPLVIEACTTDLLLRLEQMQTGLHVCQYALASYVETKRQAFPRLYFVSYTDILDLLSRGSNPFEVMMHLPKLFEGVQRIMFNSLYPAEMQTMSSVVHHAVQTSSSEPINDNRMWSTDNIKLIASAAQMSKDFMSLTAEEMTLRFNHDAIGLFSTHCEFLPFVEGPCDCVGAVEVWLGRLLSTMQTAVRAAIHSATSTILDKPRVQWLHENQAQAALVASQIQFTSEVENAFDQMESGDESGLHQALSTHLEEVASLTDHVRKTQSVNDQCKISALLTIGIHGCDTLEALIQQRCDTASCFIWKGQLRTFFDEASGSCMVAVADATFSYSHEYFGITSRLVITPLTDRCYLTLTQALKACMGGACVGPSSVGKTATIRDLGRALGRAVYVFNCSEQLDHKSVANLFKGLVMSGSWGCFDEFDLLSVDVLSLFSTQFLSISQAMMAGRKRFIFQAEEIPLDAAYGIFTTLKPTGTRRNQLSESLKMLFRPVAMVAPNSELICRNMMAARGFQDAKQLASKLTQLHRICCDVLPQTNYDWGLRAIEAVITVAGRLRQQASDQSEPCAVKSALHSYNIPKLCSRHALVFEGIVDEFFPDVEFRRHNRERIYSDIVDAATTRKLQPEQTFVDKVMQLSNLLEVRTAVCITGPPGVGKTQLWKTLAVACTSKGSKYSVRILNPKSITTQQLFGSMHHASREWNDGLLTHFLREMSEVAADLRWVVLDGNVDPVWVESLNTVMDDSRVLTLASNERIHVSSSIKILFEVDNLKHASPGSISRMGLLQLESTEMGWQSAVTSWVEQLTCQRAQSLFPVFFNTYAPHALHFVLQDLKYSTSMSDCVMVSCVCALLDALLSLHCNTLKGITDRNLFERLFVFAFVWGFGSMFDTSDKRSKFSIWWRRMFKDVDFPEAGTIFDYCVNADITGFIMWKSFVPLNPLVDTANMSISLIPTMDTVVLSYFIQHIARTTHSIMLVGRAGCGKTSMAKHALEILSDEFVSSTIACNHVTTSEHLQMRLQSSLVRKAGRTYAPSGTEQLIYFLDDLHAPALDEFDTQPPVELLVQQLNHGFWYDRVKLSMIEVQRTQFLVCANPGATRAPISQRLQRHFVELSLEHSNAESMAMVYSQIIMGYFRGDQAKAMLDLQPQLIKAMLEIHARLRRSFTPTVAKAHYRFSQHNVSSVFRGLLMVDPLQLRERNKVVRLWLHEVSRVYGDRLVCAEEVMQFSKIVQEVTISCIDDVEENELFTSPHMYCPMPSQNGGTSYKHMSDIASFRTILEEQLMQYNKSGVVRLDLVLVQDTVEHIARISRILHMKGGHMLCAGATYSIPYSISRLAAFTASIQVMNIDSMSHATYEVFVEELRRLYKLVGTQLEDTMILVNESQVKDLRILGDLHNLIASADISSVLTPDDEEEIQKAICPALKQQGRTSSRKDCLRYVTEQVSQRVHVVMCISSVGDMLQQCCWAFPSFIHSMSVNWIRTWPSSGLKAVAEICLRDYELISQEQKDLVSTFATSVHQGIDEKCADHTQTKRVQCYTMPHMFEELLITFKRLYTTHIAHLNCRIQQLQTGLQQLELAEDSITQMRQKLVGQRDTVATLHDTDIRLVAELSSKKSEIEAEREKVNREREQCKVLTAEVEKVRQIYYSNLALAEPVKCAVYDALESVDKSSLTELKSLTNPTEQIKAVLSAVQILVSAAKGITPKDLSWETVKKSIKNIDKFRSQLVEVNTLLEEASIPSNSIDAVQPYLQNHEFDPAGIQGTSVAAASLCVWVVNIVKYCSICSDIQPKHQALNDAVGALERTKVKLDEARGRVVQLETCLQTLRDEYDDVTRQQLNATEEVTRMDCTLQMAGRLMSLCEREASFWTHELRNLQVMKTAIIGDTLLASSFATYAGPFTADVRDQLVQEEWMPRLQQFISVSPNSPCDCLCSKTERATWYNEGLPSDTHSVQSAAILKASTRWPLVIDPQVQALYWLKSHAHGPVLHTTHCAHDNLTTIVGQAIQTGSVLLVDGIDEFIPVVLDPVITRSIVHSGETATMEVGGQLLVYDTMFLLILHTTMSNPHFKPDIQAHTTLVNFTLTQEALTSQLLDILMASEHPHLHEKYVASMQSLSLCKIQRKVLEDLMLQKMSSATLDILGNPDFIASLEVTKGELVTLDNDIATGYEVTEEFNHKCEQYTRMADHSAVVFLVMTRLHVLGSTYRYSLQKFKKVFEKAIMQSLRQHYNNNGEQLAVLPSTDVLAQSTLQCLQYITQYVMHGLHQSHRLLFATQVCFTLRSHTGDLPSTELHALLNIGTKAIRSNPVGEWLPDSSWGAAEYLASHVEGFQSLTRDLEDGSVRWREWYTHHQPEQIRLPQGWKDKSEFQKLLVLRALRPDRMVASVRLFVAGTVGTLSTSKEKSFLHEVYNDLDPSTPLLFLLSPGADPVSTISSLGAQFGISESNGQLVVLSLGQGQAHTAEEAIDQAGFAGNWIFLQNIHLMTPWLSTLSLKLQELKSTAEPSFRVFMSIAAGPRTCSPVPMSILQESVKVTLERRTGFKTNMLRALNTFTDTFEGCIQETEFKHVVFGLCFFHAQMIGRANYGTRGWSRAYEFDLRELRLSGDIVFACLERSTGGTPWDEIVHMVGNVVYGGHIIDVWDQRVLRASLSHIMNDSLYESKQLITGIAVPRLGTLDSVCEYVEQQLPSEGPVLFGLPPSAELHCLTKDANNLLACLQSMLDTTPAVSDMAAEQTSGSIGLANLQDMCPSMIDVGDVLQRLADDGVMDVFMHVMLQELRSFNAIVNEVRSMLTTVSQALDGDSMLTVEGEAIMRSLSNHEVPQLWCTLSQTPAQPVSRWFYHIQSMYTQLEEWSMSLKLPSVIWLRGLSHPRAFLAAVMQQNARKLNTTMDNITITTDVTHKTKDETEAAPRDGAYLTGLYLEGASFDVHHGVLRPPTVSSSTILPMLPVVHVRPVLKTAGESKSSYTCPVYQTAQRGECVFVATLKIPQDSEQAEWIIAAVAILLEQNPT